MFYQSNKHPRASVASSRHNLIKSISAPTLLSEERYGTLIERIKSLNIFSAARFDSLCMSLLHNLASYCQGLPDTANRHYALAGGLLEHVLYRAEAALSLLKAHMVSVGSDADSETDFSEEQQLWAYALFSAALVQGMGKLKTDYVVNLYNADGRQVKKWNPLIENLSAGASFYDYEFEKPADEKLRCRLNILMAKTLLPPNGYAWIASYPEVLETWLALIDEDEESSGMLGLILIRANDLAIQQYWMNFILSHSGTSIPGDKRVASFLDIPAELDVTKEQLLGAQFLKWVSDAVAKGQFVINQPPLLSVPGGLLLLPEAFEQFSRLHGWRHNNQVLKGFLALGVHREAADGGVSFQFDRQGNKGIVCQSSVLLSDTARLQSSKNTQSMSAVEILGTIHGKQLQADGPNYLSAAGKWVQEADVSLFSRLGQIPGA